ncbi:HAD family hydrolase [Polynucleobacter kasalickyi]|uniref:phosphoglycolate phosphatase n=1 Tax=Polynucleobacter kasalickyi TaxID=1938817 RepID=A0A1W1Y1R2_9BURK|nr:HAD family hydrolase [Polynucleobacter kasalickyi]SMC30077.1 phosphoglycolate phosphatase [Polynucleobacter kasalickyi]
MSIKITDIIFDLDGTLIDSAPSILECFKRVLKSNNIEPLCALNSELIGPPLAQTLSRITGIHDSEYVIKLAEDFKKHYDFDGYKSTVPFDGVGELLQACGLLGFNLHIATNKRLLPTTLILDHLGWTKHFKSIYALDSSSPSYANKAMMLAALLDSEKIDRSSGIYVGDRSEDNESALKNGLKFFGATWGYQDNNLLSNEDVICCNSIKQFEQHLNS